MFNIVVLSLVTISIWVSPAHADPVTCVYTSDNTRAINKCTFPNMPSYDQHSTKIPTKFEGKIINRNTACGPTAVASLYKTINANRDFYKPKSGTFVDNASTLDAYSFLIPGLFIKLYTDTTTGTYPYYVNKHGLNESQFNANLDNFQEFFSSATYNNDAEDYYNLVRSKKALMTMLVGFYAPSCKSVLGVKVCSFIVPKSLHYEAVKGAQYIYQNSKYTYRLLMNDGTAHTVDTGLIKLSGGCQSWDTKAKICTSWDWHLNCKNWKYIKVCEKEHILPFGASYAQSFTDDKYKNGVYTIIHGFAGLKK